MRSGPGFGGTTAGWAASHRRGGAAIGPQVAAHAAVSWASVRRACAIEVQQPSAEKAATSQETACTGRVRRYCHQCSGARKTNQDSLCLVVTVAMNC